MGKSTIVNTIVGQKVSIVSDKAQTTRKRILGIATRSNFQIVFADTPGLHTAKHKLGSLLNETIKQSLDGVDLFLVVVDSSRHPSKEDQALMKLLAQYKTPRILCLNKMDLLRPVDVEDRFHDYQKLFETETIMMTSFTRFQNVDKLVAEIVSRLPEGEPLYPEDIVTDQTVRSMSAEFVREKALRLTKQEVPHAVATYIENWEETDSLARISAVIMVETEGQKAILIGKCGSMLKKIGTQARMEIEELLDKKVFLEIFVKVRSQWRQNKRMLHDLELL